MLFVISATLILGSAIDAYAGPNDPSGDFGACLNNSGTVPCDVVAEWGDGQITTEISYTEGDSIPTRVDMTNLSGDDTIVHTLIVFWDTTKSDNDVSHTFDYITTYDNNDDPHPCLVAHPNSGPDTVCKDFGKDTKPIPDPGTKNSLANTIVDTKGGLLQPLAEFQALDEDEEQGYIAFAVAPRIIDE